MIDYDSFSRCHLTDIFFAFHAGAKELSFDRRHYENLLLLKAFISAGSCSKYNIRLIILFGDTYFCEPTQFALH